MTIQINSKTELKDLTAFVAKETNTKLSTLRNAFAKFYQFNEYSSLVAKSFDTDETNQVEDDNSLDVPEIGFNQGNFFVDDVIIPERVMQEINEISGLSIEYREDRIDDLIQMISESPTHSDKYLMKEDLKTLINSDDEFIFGYYSTNGFITTDSDLEEFIESANKIVNDFKEFISDAMSPEVVKEIIENCNPSSSETENEALEYAIQTLKDHNKNEMANVLMVMSGDGCDDAIEALEWIVNVAENSSKP